jgi:threonylcarbamoyladenosine tRNA methylthiotransferase MtaB
VTYAIVTFGCRVNQADSTDIERQLRAQGGRRADAEDAELVIVNTCSVTASADHGARQIIRRIARKNPTARIVATGCYATRAKLELASLPNVTAVVSNSEKWTLVAAVAPARAHDDTTTAERFGDGDGSCGERISPGSGRTTYTLRVQTGCDEVCAYCIIPSTRGSGRSMPVSRVVEEVDRMVAEGFKEASLTGVHIGSYGRDLSPRTSLLELVRVLDAHPSDLLFRISSLEPMDCSEEIVDLVARSGRFAPHFHLPLQNASDRLLRAMRRPYSRGYYQRLVDTIRGRMPHAGIGSDLVVGFPGETADDVEANLEYLAASPLTYLHVFPYSDRPGTEASGLAAKVDGKSVRERARAIRAKGSELAEYFRMSQLGSVRPALTIDGGRVAVTDNYLKVRIPAGQPENQRVRVRITSADEPPAGELVG